MRKDIYEKIISFLLGASWGLIFFGAYFTFKSAIVFGLALAILLTIIFLFCSLFFLLLLDALQVHKQRLEEAKKQTALLEKIYAKHTK